MLGVMNKFGLAISEVVVNDNDEQLPLSVVNNLANNDDVQMLDNFYIGIANGHLWSLIMLYLG